MKPPVRFAAARGAAIAAFAILFGIAASPAHAAFISQTVTLTPGGSDNHVTNGHVLDVFSVVPTFNQFNPVLGTLLSATLQWSATGSLTVTGSNQGQAIMSYETSSKTLYWDLCDGSTTLNFSIGGAETLNLAAVKGTGTFSQGTFKETYQWQQGNFPAGFSTGFTTATFTLKYVYQDAFQAAATPVTPNPEPETVALVLPILAGLLIAARRRVTARSR